MSRHDRDLWLVVALFVVLLLLSYYAPEPEPNAGPLTPPESLYTPTPR